MPITVSCFSCEAKLNAPDTAAGKRVKCPKCGGIISVPADEAGDDFEVVEDDFEVVDDVAVKAESKPRRVGRDDGETAKQASKKRILADDEDDEVQRPRKKSKRKAPAKKSLLLPILGGGILATVILALGLFFILKKSKPGDPDKQTWTLFTSQEGNFTTSFPDGNPESGDLFELLEGGSNNRGPSARKKDLQDIPFKSEGWFQNYHDRRYIAGYIKMPPGITQFTSDAVILENMTPPKSRQKTGEKIVSITDTTLAGFPARRVVTEKQALNSVALEVVIFGVKQGTAYFLLYRGIGIQDNDPIGEAFISKFSLGSSETATKPSSNGK